MCTEHLVWTAAIHIFLLSQILSFLSLFSFSLLFTLSQASHSNRNTEISVRSSQRIATVYIHSNDIRQGEGDKDEDLSSRPFSAFFLSLVIFAVSLFLLFLSFLLSFFFSFFLCRKRVYCFHACSCV